MDSSSSGSKYNRADASKSVETVSGLLFTMIGATPSSRSALADCTQQQSNSMPCPMRIGPLPRMTAFGPTSGVVTFSCS